MVTRNKNVSLDSELIEEFQRVIDGNSRIKGNFSLAIAEHMRSVIEEDRTKSQLVESLQKSEKGDNSCELIKDVSNETALEKLHKLGISWILDYENYQHQNKIQNSLSQQENEFLTYALRRTSERFLLRCPEGKYRPQNTNVKLLSPKIIATGK